MRLQIDKPLPGTLRDPLYPDSDGRPMGDTDFHSAAMTWLKAALEDFFARAVDVYVAMNLLIYYERGNPRGRRDPDILVARGVGKHLRRSYRLWEENVLPCTLFEIASEHTWQTDLGDKRKLYERLGIREYFIFDPENRFLNPPLQGFRLQGNRYVPLKQANDGSLTSRELGLRIVPENGMLRLVDIKTGKKVLTRAEAAHRAKQRSLRDKKRATYESQRAELAEQNFELAEKHAELADKHAELAQQHAELAEQLAKQEKQRADRLAEELDRFRKAGREGG